VTRCGRGAQWGGVSAPPPLSPSVVQRQGEAAARSDTRLGPTTRKRVPGARGDNGRLLGEAVGIRTSPARLPSVPWRRGAAVGRGGVVGRVSKVVTGRPRDKGAGSDLRDTAVSGGVLGELGWLRLRTSRCCGERWVLGAALEGGCGDGVLA
jgi:hypothetical protein